MTIMAGNVVTGEMVEELIMSGADIIKVNKVKNHTWNRSGHNIFF